MLLQRMSAEDLGRQSHVSRDTALMVAIKASARKGIQWQDGIKTCQLLISKTSSADLGKNADHRRSNRSNALIQAVESQSPHQIVVGLLSKMNPEDVNYKNRAGKSALNIARDQGDFLLIYLLLNTPGCIDD